MQVRRDHIAGGAILIAGALVLAASTDLPFGTLASPGAGMLPTLVVAVMMALAASLIIAAGSSPPHRNQPWGDGRDAAAGTAETPATGGAYTPMRVTPR